MSNEGFPDFGLGDPNETPSRPSHSTGVDLIAAERQRQIDRAHYDVIHDDGHDQGELAHAASLYLARSRGAVLAAEDWPWEAPGADPDRLQDLVKAGGADRGRDRPN
jgi:hypothetical protein